MSFALTKEERLKTKDFRSVRWKRDKETTYFSLLGKENPHCMKRIGITIQKRAGGAVRRNRMRRLIREFFRLHKPLFKDHYDSVVKVKGIPETIIWKDISKELQVLVDSHVK